MTKSKKWLKSTEYISCAYTLNDCGYRVTEGGFIWERNYRTRTSRRFELSPQDIVRVGKIANMYSFGRAERAEMLRDIFYEYLDQTW